MNSLKGQLLVSAGGLRDPNFRHTVVLIGEHAGWGAVGVVLNRPLDATVQDTVPALAELTGAEELLFEGGPVEPQQAVLLVETDDPSILDVPVFASVGFLTGDVSTEVRRSLRRARVFLGHSGWGPGQLEAELESGAWILESARDEDVFTTEPAALWRTVLQRKGPPWSQQARIPFDPSTN